MLGPLLLLQLAVGAPRQELVYSSPALEAFVTAAAQANHVPPVSLRGYRASVESELSLLIRDTLGRERTAQVEQIAMSAAWRRGSDYDLRVVGYRSQTVGVPYSALSFARSWTLPYLYGDRLTLGVEFTRENSGPRRRVDSSATDSAARKREADTVRAIHPLALDRDRYYRFSGGDTIAVLRSHDRMIPIVRVHVKPAFDSASLNSRVGAFDGEIDFDAVRHQIVRMRGQFVVTPGPRRRRISLARLPGLVGVAYVEFVNAEVEGQYWLPAFQRSEFQAAFAPLGADRSIFRLVSRFGNFDVSERLPTDSMSADSQVVSLAATERELQVRRRLTFAPLDSVSSYRGWREALGTATSSVAGSDFDDLAPDVWRDTGPPRFDMAPAKLEEMFRFNRVEGAYTGFAASERFRNAWPGLTAHAFGGWAWTEQTMRGGTSATYRAGAWTTTARAERMLASTNDFTLPLESGGEGFGALVFGVDDQDYVDRRIAALSLTRTLGTSRGAVLVVEGGIGDDRPELARLSRPPFGAGSFRLNRGSTPGRYARGAATFELHPDVTGLFLEPGAGLIASYELATGQLSWQRAELTLAARKNLSDLVIAGRAQGGVVVGKALPPQQLFELGGVSALPGYQYKAFAGDRAAVAGMLASYTFPVLRRPWRVVRSLVLPGVSPGIAAGVQGGWTEASTNGARVAMRRLDPVVPFTCDSISPCAPPLSTPTNGVRATADLRLTFFSGLVGVGIARPIDHAAPWRFAFRFSQEY
jgi:hypothetical protein